MNDQAVQMLEKILDINENIYGVALIDGKGKVLAQTGNWDIRKDAPGVLATWNANQGSVSILGIRYIVVENIPERLIATNPTGKGHVIALTAGPAKLVVYINPAIGPTQVLNDVYMSALRLAKVL
ncbi:MAG: hypothetical protein GYA24_03560 [Candidatus Lokiarchaeota archaeon]|nr:hypothetical protein [Candidatus Lokiarchaeota archaeon]